MLMCVVFVILMELCFCWFFFFFKQKTAYEMRISDWSSDVCSSDLFSIAFVHARAPSRQSAIAWSAVLTITFIAAVIGTISRAALGLTLLGLVASINLYLVRAQGKRRLWLLIGSGVALAVMVYFFSFSSVVTKDRKSTRLNSSH